MPSSRYFDEKGTKNIALIMSLFGSVALYECAGAAMLGKSRKLGNLNDVTLFTSLRK